MKLPLAWLKKYISVSLSAEALADKLTLSGSKVECVENVAGEPVIDIEVTTNRPDCLSVLGLAYEVSAITGKKVTVPAAYKGKARPSTQRSGIKITIQDKKACPRYTARILENVSVKPSPVEVQKFMAYMGARSISNIVDATNYVLFECGQPLHAFDLDKIKGAEIIVRASKKGEKFLGIDGLEYALDDKTLVIADAERPIAIAGVMGGKLTEVTHETKNILLESACFDLALVRQASKKYKLSTESSYRFERGVNPAFVPLASKRAAELILEWAGGSEGSGLLDKNFVASKTGPDITLRLDRMEMLLGMKISASRTSQILKSLSLTVKPQGKNRLKVARTLSRRDLAQEVDLIEEVLRIEGFDKIPVKLPQSRHGLEDVRDRKALRTRELKKWMTALGFQEIMTYSLLSERALQNTGLSPDRCHTVANAVSAEQAYFRPSLLPGLLQAILFNVSRKAHSLRLFEIGNVYANDRERTVLSFALYGMWEENWHRKSEASYYEAKGVLENVLGYLGAPDTAAVIEAVSPAILKKWDITHPVYFVTLELDAVLNDEPRSFKVKPVPKYPAVKRDIAVVLESTFAVRDLAEAMKQAAAPHLKSVTLFDQFIGKNIPPGKRSLAFSLQYQKDDGTFTDPEIQKLQEQVGQALKEKFRAEFR